MRKKLFAAALVLSVAAPVAAVVAMPGDDAPLVTKSGPLGAPEAGTGQVVFYRPGSLMGAALGCTVREGDTQIARLGSGKFYAVSVAPGVHTYNTRGEAKDEIRLEVEADETYFVRCNIGMGVMAGRANLSPSDREAFAKKAKGLKMWEPKDDPEEKEPKAE
ncbi:DUF2846 domain-containing protein [Sphingomonas sp. ST-64]|uniref:DUF2846 domain-containing protein n=1 Tax=Sphingomonas plantiphila TaxID=3163295 RepID=A0ABW8YPY4_9SPHN